jgi:hypothetical protein
VWLEPSTKGGSGNRFNRRDRRNYFSFIYIYRRGKIMDKFFNQLMGIAAKPAPTYAIRSGGTSNAPIGGLGGVLPYVWGEAVYILSTAPGGTEPPNGTRAHPCATLAQARTVAAARGINIYHMLDSFTLDADMPDSIFRSDTPIYANVLGLGGFSVNNCTFVNIAVGGDAHAATVDMIYAWDSIIGIATNPINMWLRRCCLWTGVHYLEDQCWMEDCYSIIGNITLDCTTTTGGGDVEIIDWKSGLLLTIDNLTAAGAVIRISGRGSVNITAACTAGTIFIEGDIIITNGGTSTVHDHTIKTILETLAAGELRTRCVHIAQWGAPTEEIQLTDAATDTAFPQIVISKIPTGAVVTCAYLGIKYGAIENTAVGVNKVNGAQHIQISKGGGAWADAIHIPDDYLSLAGATREGGDIIWGDIDIAATITGNDTYTFQWDAALVDADFMLLNNVQTVLYIEYSI